MLKNRKKALTQVMNTDGIVLEMASTFYQEFFRTRDYERHYQVQPGDIVVDIGACIGMMSAGALDRGASKVYMIEGNRKLLRTAIDNVAEHIMNEPTTKVYPINCIMGAANEGATGAGGVFTTHEDDVGFDEIDRMSFREFIRDYSIDRIDYLKIDIEGNEYDILNEENLEFIDKNVKHMAIEIHTQAGDNTLERFFHFRDTFLKHFKDSPRHTLRGAGDGYFINNTMWDNATVRSLDLHSSYFMLYITRE
jgi:FkbM family methyltransferase